MKNTLFLAALILVVGCNQVGRKNEKDSPSTKEIKIPEKGFRHTSSSRIIGFLQGSLTDKEEGEIVGFVKKAKESNTLNELISELSISGSLDIVIERWDEEIINYKHPNMIDEAVSWFTSDTSPDRPNNNNMFTDFISDLYTGNLDKSNSHLMVSSISRIYYGKPYESEKDISYGLQSDINRVLSLNEISDFSEETLALFTEILKPFKGTPSKIHLIDAGRKKLGLPISESTKKSDTFFEH